jgi:hypothetical protein
VSNHQHDNPSALDDPDHEMYIREDENPEDALFEAFEVPGRFAATLDLLGRHDVAKKLPFAAMIAAAARARNILAEYCAANHIAMPLQVGVREAA